jgi:hypothetical protein
MVKQLWQGTSKPNISPENSKIFRILSHQFFTQHAHLSVQLARKIRHDVKITHHKRIRDIV